jgi:type 1 fimbriae regulatory protein FimB/type 1 fimbriae regulatory protein FimE
MAKKKVKVYPPRPPGSPPRRLFNADYRDVEWLPEEEVKAMWLAAAKVGRNGDRDSAMIKLAFHHGLRSSETVGLRWERVFLDRHDILVVRCKGSTTRDHPLFLDDITALRKLGPEKTGWVFKSESRKGTGHVSESGFQKIVERAGELAGIKYPVHPHMLRHSCGFWLRKQRYDLLDIRDWLGHVSVKNTERYAEAGSDRFREIGLGGKKEK